MPRKEAITMDINYVEELTLATPNCHVSLEHEAGDWVLSWITAGAEPGEKVRHVLISPRLYVIIDMLDKLRQDEWTFVDEEKDVNPELVAN